MDVMTKQLSLDLSTAPYKFKEAHVKIVPAADEEPFADQTICAFKLQKAQSIYISDDDKSLFAMSSLLLQLKELLNHAGKTAGDALFHKLGHLFQSLESTADQVV